MASFGTLRLLKDDGTHGAVYKLKEEKCSIGSLITCSIRLYNHDANLKDVHCIVDVYKNGVATLINKAPKNPVQINGANVSKQRCLRSGDVISILNTRLLYENKKLSHDTIEKTEKQAKHTRLMKEGRKSVRPVKQVRSLADPIRSKKTHTVVATKKRVSSLSGSVSKFVTSRRATNRPSVSPLLPSKRISTPVLRRGIRVHTPLSTNKPSSSGRTDKSNRMQSFNEINDYDDDRRSELKTPVTEHLDENNFATPQNNTSLVVVESPIEEEPPVRSKKVKNMSMNRLAQNDDSVIVLGTPGSKTPVLKIGAKIKTPKSALKKSKLLTEMLDAEICTSTPAKRKSVIIVEDTVGDGVSAMSDFTEESIHDTSIADISAVEPSRKSNRASESFPSAKRSSRKSTVYASSKSMSSVQDAKSKSKISVSSILESDSTPETSSRKVIGRGVKRRRDPDDSFLPAKKIRYKLSTTIDESELDSSIELSVLTSPDVLVKRAMTEPKLKKKRVVRNSLPSVALFSDDVTPSKLSTSKTSPIKSAKANRSRRNTIASKDKSIPLNSSTPVGKSAMTDPKSRKKSTSRNSALSTNLFTNAKDESTTSINLSPEFEKFTSRKSSNDVKTQKKESTSFTLDDSKNSTFELSPLQISNPLEERLAMTEPKIQKRRTTRNSLPNTNLFPESDSVESSVLNSTETVVQKNESLYNGSVDSILLEDDATDVQKRRTLRNSQIDDSENITQKIESPPSRRSIISKKLALTEPKVHKKIMPRKSVPGTILFGESNSLTPKIKSVRGSRRNTTSSFIVGDSKSLHSVSLDHDAMAKLNLENKRKSTTLFGKLEGDENNSTIEESPMKDLINSTPLMESKMEKRRTLRNSLTSAQIDDSIKNSSVKRRKINSFIVSDTKAILRNKHAMTEPKVTKKRLPRKSVPGTILFGDSNSVTIESSPLRNTSAKTPTRNTRRKTISFVVTDVSTSGIKSGKQAMTEPKSQKKPMPRKSLPNTKLFEQGDDENKSFIEEDSVNSTHLNDEPKIQKRRTMRSTLGDDSPALETKQENLSNATPVMVNDEMIESPPVKKSIPLGRSMTEPRIQKRRALRKSVPGTILFEQSDTKSANNTPLKRSVNNSKASTPLNDSIAKRSANNSKVSTPLNHSISIGEVQNKRMSRNSLTSIFQLTNDDDDIGDSTIESMDTSSFIYVPGGRLTRSSLNNSVQDVEEAQNDPSKSQDEPLNDLSSPKGVKQLFKTPKPQKEPENDLLSPKGVKKLLKTPKPQKEPENDLTSPRGVKKLLKTPKPQKEPKNDLSSPKGVKKLLRTPKPQNEPLNDLSSPKGVKRLLKTPKPQKEPENDLTSPRGVKKLLKTPKPQKEPKNDLSSPKGVKQLLKTPKPQKEPENDLTSPKGVKKLLKTPKPQKEPLNDLSSPKGVKKLLATPKPQKEPENDLSSPKGVKQLLKTPKPQKEPENDLTSPKGVKKLLKTPKPQKEPLNDLSSPRGVKKLLKTPKPQKEPENDLTSPKGVKQLLKTPKPQKEPENDLTSPKGVKKLLKTPKPQKEPLNDLSSPRGVKKLLATPKPQKEPLNDLSSPKGVKKLLKTPKPKSLQKEPKNDLSNPLGVKQLLRTPKDQKEPENDLTNPLGVKRLMRTPKIQNEPENDLTNPLGVKQLMRTPKLQKEPDNDLTNPLGVKQLLRTPKIQKEPENDLTNPLGVKQLMQPINKAQKEPENDLTNPIGLRALFSPKFQKEPKNDLSEVEDLRELFKSPNIRTYSRKNRSSNTPQQVEEEIDSTSYTNVKNWLEGQNLQSELIEAKEEDASVKGRKRKVLTEKDQNQKPAIKKRTRRNALESGDDITSSTEDVKENVPEVRTRRGRVNNDVKDENEVKIPKRTRGKKKVEEIEEESSLTKHEKDESSDEQNLEKAESSSRRGRGRKNVDVSVEKQEGVRRGGRLRKHEDVTSSDENHVEKESDVEVEDKKISSSVDEVKSTDESNVEVPKRGGRGRKQVEVVEKIETPKRTRGRRRVDSVEVIEVPTTKRGRGRKNVDSEEKKEEVTEVEEVIKKEETTKRGGGKRNKKVEFVEDQKVAEELVSADIEEDVKRGGKRNKKVEVVDDQKISIEVVSADNEDDSKVLVDANTNGVENDDVKIEEVVEVPTKRTRGNRKVKTDTPKATRGRKKIEEEIVDEHQVEKVETPRRGRGRKKVEEINVVEEKIETPRRGRGKKKSESVETPEVVIKSNAEEQITKDTKKAADTIEIDILPVEPKRKRKQIKSIDDIQQEALEMAPPASPKRTKRGKAIVVEPSSPEQAIRRSARTRK